MREEAEREAKRERERKKYNKQLAEMSDSMGTLIEDIVWPNATRVASELFGTDPVLSIGRRLVRRLPTDAGRHMEIDILASGRQHVMVIEAKRKLDAEKVREFVERLSQLAEFFPETAGLRLMPVIASVTIEESVIAFLNRQKVYGLAMGDETMELVNRGQF